MKRRLVPLAALLVVLACSRKKEEKVNPRLEQPRARVPVSEMNEAVRKASEVVDEAPPPKPVNAVKFDLLLPFLPKAPAGWVPAGPPTGETSQAMSFAVSVVRRTYQGPGTMEVSITDTAYQPMLTTGVRMAAQLAKQTAEGYERGVTIAGCPGVEHWRKDGQHAELTVVVGRRYLVAIRASNVPDGFTRSVFESIDRTGLANLK